MNRPQRPMNREALTPAAIVDRLIEAAAPEAVVNVSVTGTPATVQRAIKKLAGSSKKRPMPGAGPVEPPAKKPAKPDGGDDDEGRFEPKETDEPVLDGFINDEPKEESQAAKLVARMLG